MHQNIKRNSRKRIDAKLYSANYYDFMLYKGETTAQSVSELNSMLFADFSDLNIESGLLYSTSTWSGSTNNGVNLKHIGLTGVDNGLVSYKGDRITYNEFKDLIINSEYTINSNDNRLFLTPITGNTNSYSYPLFLCENEEERYISYKGGFHQGFFKLYGYDYQVLPNKIDDEWLLHFELRPRSDYNTNESIINDSHKENKGIFFFLGNRAENKFWPYYVSDKEYLTPNQKEDALSEGYFAEEDYFSTLTLAEPITGEWLLEETLDNNAKNTKDIPTFSSDDSYMAFHDDYFASTAYACNIKHEDEEEYFLDEFYDNRFPEKDNNKIFVDEYIGTEEIVDIKENIVISARTIENVMTDNKFLLFNRTSTGKTIDTWNEGDTTVLINQEEVHNDNYFLLMDRTSTGYTKDTIHEYHSLHEKNFNIYNDIQNNVFALRIRDDGAIGYRYGIYTCENDVKYKIVEEYSKEGLIKDGEWNSINVRIVSENPSDDCDNRYKEMKLFFYVNGFLIFISKNLPMFNFYQLDEIKEKQETVPYNISLGGGSLGLLESILPDYVSDRKYILPIERDFCGSFIGDIKSFKMYGGLINYSSITNYLS